jgi:hypothetical protein
MSVAQQIPHNLEERYKKHLVVKPVKRPKSLRASFKTTLWWSAAQWIQLLSMSAELKTGRMSLNAFLIERLGLADAESVVPKATQLAAIRHMIKPPDELAARRGRKPKR